MALVGRSVIASERQGAHGRIRRNCCQTPLPPESGRPTAGYCTLKRMNTRIAWVCNNSEFNSPLEHNPARSEYSGETRSVSGSPTVRRVADAAQARAHHPSIHDLAPTLQGRIDRHVDRHRTEPATPQETDPHRSSRHSACRLGPVTCPTMPNRRRGMCPPRTAHNDRAPETSEAGHDTGTHSEQPVGAAPAEPEAETRHAPTQLCLPTRMNTDKLTAPPAPDLRDVSGLARARARAASGHGSGVWNPRTRRATTGLTTR
jgi:hypothetical protein